MVRKLGSLRWLYWVPEFGVSVSGEIHRSWHWHFEAPPLAVWRVMADTARFNEAAGFPKHEIEARQEADGSTIYIGTARIAGFTVRWRDIPIDWGETSPIVTSSSARRFAGCVSPYGFEPRTAGPGRITNWSSRREIGSVA